jgi:N-acyl-D-amino-acid deacylase
MPINRRNFVATSAGAFAALATPAVITSRRVTADLIVRGGNVFDGSGSRGVESDVVVTGDVVSAIGRRSAERGGIEIDARGLAVAPGFIDIHSHGDGSLGEDPRAESLIRQGITTIVVGQDGSSRGIRKTDLDLPAGTEGGFAAAMRAIEQGRPAVNVASMVGLGSIRGAIVGNDDRPATPDEIKQMRALVERALAEGACGASSGLEYTPGAFASTQELATLCEPLAARGLPYATHMRNEDDRLIESIDESIAVARGARCPLQISHLKTQGQRNWGKLDTAFARVAAARASGIDAAFDRYPYVAYQTGLTNLFPVWSRDGGTQAFLGRLDDPAVSPKIKQETLAKVDMIGGWDNVMVTSVGSATEHKPVEGARLGTYSKQRSADPYDMALTLLRATRGSVGMVGFAMSEDNLDRILAHPQGMVCSDGGAFAIEGPSRRGSPHPRGLGTFPRVLGRYVRERKALTLEQAIHKMSSFPASRIKFRNRGRLAIGAAADIVVFDPSSIADTATFDQPFQYPVGVTAVVVNGGVVLLHGGRTDRMGAGRFVRPG